MKKFKKLSLLCATLGIVFATATTAFADDGKEIKKFYNFNDYTAEVGSDIMPDDNWDYLAQGSNQFGSAFADDEHQRVLKANNGSAPHFYFGQSLTTGNIHISFEAKMLSTSQRLISRWYHQRKWGTATLPRRTEASESGYSMLLSINQVPNAFRWYQKPGKDTTSMLGWDQMKSDESFDFTQWHRFDIITNGLSGNDCYANIYLDGVKMNETPIYFGASEGFHTFGFKTEVGDGGSNPLGAYIDNVNIHRFSGTESLDMNITSDERVALNDGKLKVNLSDFVDTSDLTKDNIKISQKGGGSISNYSITPDANGGGFDVNFSGAIEPGRYEIRLSNNVRGKLTGAVSGDALTFKTDFKTVNVDGSIYDNDFNDYTSTDGTPPSGFSVSGEKSYAKSVEGKNGGNDRAFGLKSDENGRTVQRYMTKFNADIRPDSDGNISFDFTVPTADTGEVRFYLSTPNDPEKNAPNALFKVDSTGNVYIADSETANPSKKLDGIRLAANEWHNVNAKIRTDGNPQYDNDHRRIMSINESGVSDGVINSGTSASAGTNMNDIGNKWTKVTLDYNAETGESRLYVNGEEISERGNSYDGTKRINIIAGGRDNAVDNEILIDNIYIRHSQDELSEIPAKADYVKSGVKQNGGVVKMAFAETLKAFGDESEYLPTDFVLKDSNGGVIENGITNVAPDSDKPEIKFTLGNLSKGLYTIGLSEAAKSETDQYKGALSGKFPGEIIFSTEGNAQNQQDARRYYVNENFEGYNGGMANGMVSNLFGYSNAANMTKVTETDSQHKNTLAINATDSAIWKFDESIKGGVFNIEFDVKSNGEKWGINLIKARDFLPQNYVPGDYWETLTPGNTTVQEPTNTKDWAQWKYYTAKLAEAEATENFDKDAWLTNDWITDWRNYRISDTSDAVKSRFDSRQMSMRRSHVLGTTLDAAKYSYSTLRSQYSTYGPTYVDTIDSTFPAATSDWTHIKVKVDTEAAKYYLTVGDKTVELPYDPRNFNLGGSTKNENIPASATSYDINTGKIKVTRGFGGIGLYADNSTGNSSVQFDNIQVYTDDSYNSYSTFDNAGRETYSEGTTGNTKQGGVDMPNWFTVDNLNYTLVERNPYGLALANGDGRDKNTNSSDKALMINCGKAGAGSILNLLNVPIKSGREFNVEFDYKCNQEQSFMLGLVESGNILPYKLSSTLDGSNLEGKIEDTKGSTGLWNDTNLTSNRIILFNRGTSDSGQVGDHFRFRNGTSGYFDLGSANTKDAVSKDDETKTIDYTKGQWHHIKLNVKPNGNVLQETLTVTYEDGTSVTSQAYNTNLASVNDIAALVFKFIDANKYITTAQNSQHLIDNLAVYEVGDVNNTYLTNVFAIDADGTESVINDACKATTKQLKLNFSGKLASTKGISIGTAGETALTPEYTLSNDKTSVLVSFNRALLPGEKINIAIGSDLDTERESYLQKAEPYSTQITVTAAEGELKLAEARLYKWVDSRTYLSQYGNVTTTAGYYPMGAEVLNDVTSKDKFKLVVKGTNFSGSDYTACIMQCVYDSSNRLIDVNIIPKEINQGVFDMSQEDISCAKENAAKIKFYVWRDNTLIPVANYLDYDVTTTAAKQPTE